jgi:hypothetical protein
MKNLNFPTWKREADPIMNTTTYSLPVANDIVISVEFDDVIHEYVSRTTDTATYESDIRDKLTGPFENSKESVAKILETAKTLKHHSY